MRSNAQAQLQAHTINARPSGRAIRGGHCQLQRHASPQPRGSSGGNRAPSAPSMRRNHARRGSRRSDRRLPLPLGKQLGGKALPFAKPLDLDRDGVQGALHPVEAQILTELVARWLRSRAMKPLAPPVDGSPKGDRASERAADHDGGFSIDHVALFRKGVRVPTPTVPYRFTAQDCGLTPKLSCKRPTEYAAHLLACDSISIGGTAMTSDDFALVSCSDSLDGGSQTQGANRRNNAAMSCIAGTARTRSMPPKNAPTPAPTSGSAGLGPPLPMSRLRTDSVNRAVPVRP
jgi:hypothetical protein